MRPRLAALLCVALALAALVLHPPRPARDVTSLAPAVPSGPVAGPSPSSRTATAARPDPVLLDLAGLRARFFASPASAPDAAFFRSLAALETGAFPTLLDSLAELPGDPVRENLLAAVFREWIRREAAAAVSAAFAPGRGPAFAVSAAATAFGEWSAESPVSAAALLEALAHDRRAQEILLGSAAESWAVREPGEAFAWAAARADPVLQAGALAEFTRALAPRDLSGAATELAARAHLPAAAEAAAWLASTLVEERPASVLPWLRSLPSGPLRAGAVEAAFATWAAREPEVAALAHARLTGSPDRDAAAAGLAAGTFSRDPAAALSWIDAVGDAGRRDALLEQFELHLGVRHPELPLAGPP
jgi:hypothetical protein